jgi:hypothetical protein
MSKWAGSDQMQTWGYVQVLWTDTPDSPQSSSLELDLGASINVVAFAMISGINLSGPGFAAAGIPIVNNKTTWGGLASFYPVNPLYQGDAQTLTFWWGQELFTGGVGSQGITATLVVLST